MGRFSELLKGPAPAAPTPPAPAVAPTPPAKAVAPKPVAPKPSAPASLDED